MRVMKLTALFLFAFAIHLSARVSSQVITYSSKNASLENIFKIVKEQTGFYVLYDPSVIQNAKPVSVHADRWR